MPAHWQRNVSPTTRSRWHIWASFLMIFGGFAAGIYTRETTLIPVLDSLSHGARLMLRVSPFASAHQPNPETETSAATPAVPAPGEANRNATSLPLPDSYGLYAVSGGQLTRLESMRMRIPDIRIAIPALITKPSPVRLPDGRLFFVAYQRDLATNAPDTAAIRIVAQVSRDLTFGATGSPKVTPVQDTWAIRALSVDLNVAPVPESREMLLLRPMDPKLSLAPGRYMLVFNNQAYDFTVEGAVSDMAHCLERAETQNGNVYSECRELPKPPELNVTLRLSHSLR